MGGGPLSADHPDFAHRATELAHVAAWRAFGRFLEAARASKIPVLPVKGILTADLLYARAAERPIADVDVRVLPEHVRAVERLARDRGWPILERSRMYGKVTLEVAGIALDVESTIGPPGMCGLAVADMLRRATEQDLGGHRVLVPEIHDHALLLAVNVFKDKLVRAAPWAVEDLERIVVVPAFHATELAARARACGASTLVWIVADWLTRTRGSAPWQAVRDACGPLRRKAYAGLYRALVERAAWRPGLLPLVARLASDRPLDRVGAVARAIAWQAAHPRRWS
jgi:hypothetical protein